MKKVLLIVALALATFAGANAQWYAGGSLGFESNSDKSGIDPKSGFSLAPEVGYYLTDKFDIGLDFGFVTGKNQSDDKFSYWIIAPYARYSFLQFGKFEVLGKGSLFFSGYDFDNGDKGTEFGINVAPIVAYNLTDNFVLFTELNFVSLNFTSVSPDGGDTYTQFGLGVDANGIANTGNIQIGMVYKF